MQTRAYWRISPWPTSQRLEISCVWRPWRGLIHWPIRGEPVPCITVETEQDAAVTVAWDALGGHMGKEPMTEPTHNYIRHTFKVGKYTCTLGTECPPLNAAINLENGELLRLSESNVLDCIWKPKRPNRFTKAMARDYLAGRNKLMQMIVDRTGLDFAMVR
jgi:hypothetical protein